MTRVQSYYAIAKARARVMLFTILLPFQCLYIISIAGKTSALRLALSPFGVTDYLGGKSTMASIVNQAATSTLPIGLDDIKSPAVFEDITVQFFNGSLHSTISSGSIRARASVLVTANQAFCDTER